MRTSVHLPKCFILSLRYNLNVYHAPIYLVSKRLDSALSYQRDILEKIRSERRDTITLDLHGDEGPFFKDLTQLVWFYETNHGKPLPCRLQHPVTKVVCIASKANPAMAAFSL